MSILFAEKYQRKEQFKIDNTSLPANASVPEGQKAVFHCLLSYTDQVAANFYALFEFSQPVQNLSETSETYKCTKQFTFYSVNNETIGNCSLPKSARFQMITTSFQVAKATTLTLQILKVSADLSGSRVTCSLYRRSDVDNIHDVLQWRRVAHLKVLPADPLVPNAFPPAGSGSLVGALVSVLIVIIAVVSIATGTTVILWKRHARHVGIPNSDEGM